jgi:HPt (histidine-containing phosphotransfer) domain-containing protein
VASHFDQAQLLERVDNDLAFLAETVDMLVADAPGLMGSVRAAAAAADAPALARHAHALKGMISNFCAPQAQAAALEVERLGRAGDLASAAPAIDTLAQRLTSLIDELSGFVKAST